eukprot:SAG22_NODE_225_length_14728_cov_58.742361_16_plen_110_part_00
MVMSEQVVHTCELASQSHCEDSKVQWLRHDGRIACTTTGQASTTARAGGRAGRDARVEGEGASMSAAVRPPPPGSLARNTTHPPTEHVLALRDVRDKHAVLDRVGDRHL